MTIHTIRPMGSNMNDFIGMLEIQSHLNERIDKDWIAKHNKWTRAIWIETAEGLDHFGWKWWKKQLPNLPQCRIELVDIWHFILSDALQGTNGNIPGAAAMISTQLDEQRTEFNILGEKFYVGSLPTETLFDKFGGLAALGHVFIPGFAELMDRCFLTWSDLQKLYVSKNVLNVFRQDHGYKEGTYIKSWHGAEDNVWLEEYMGKNPKATPDELNMALVAAYAEVVSNAD